MTTATIDSPAKFKGLDTATALRPSTLSCPECRRAGGASILEPKSADNVDFFHCRRCGGVWFHDKHMDEALAAASALNLPAPQQPATPAPQGADWQCPCCKGVLVTVLDRRGSGVQVRRCLVCYGGWIEHAEVRKTSGSDLLSRIGRLARRLVS